MTQLTKKAKVSTLWQLIWMLPIFLLSAFIFSFPVAFVLNLIASSWQGSSFMLVTWVLAALISILCFTYGLSFYKRKQEEQYQATGVPTYLR